MKRFIKLAIHTEPTGEYCLLSCPQMAMDQHCCDAFNVILKFREENDVLRPVRHTKCKSAESGRTK